MGNKEERNRLLLLCMRGKGMSHRRKEVLILHVNKKKARREGLFYQLSLLQLGSCKGE